MQELLKCDCLVLFWEAVIWILVLKIGEKFESVFLERSSWVFLQFFRMTQHWLTQLDLKLANSNL